MLVFVAVNVQFNPVVYTASEGSSDQLIVILNVASTQELTVDIDTMDGTAQSGCETFQ